MIGATGNVGTSLLDALAREPAVTSVLGVARRRPELSVDKVVWEQADIGTDDLLPLLADADAAVHLAWLLQPSRNEAQQWRTNVVGTGRLLAAVEKAGISTFVYASSIGAYSPAPPGVVVDESHPTDGVATSQYSRQKAYTERQLDAFESRNPGARVVRMRKGLIIKPGAASGIRRLFAGPLLPTPLLRAVGVPVWPATRGLQLQFVHSHDVADAYRLAIVGDAQGAFNIAADPVIDAPTAAKALDAVQLPLAPRVLRATVAASWRLRLQPAEPGWIDLALGAPLMSTKRAHSVLGWWPVHRADDTLAELVQAVGRSQGLPTPPLAPSTSWRGRMAELKSGVGRRST
ncbi:MAG: NAD-dependent epimerase/dehydratase family protein [Nitriliruptorales bacterium]|nr:NAD-dependent epimerase/dehydratase family protein [Nitriliruptorales bacterium]